MLLIVAVSFALMSKARIDLRASEGNLEIFVFFCSYEQYTDEFLRQQGE